MPNYYPTLEDFVQDLASFLVQQKSDPIHTHKQLHKLTVWTDENNMEMAEVELLDQFDMKSIDIHQYSGEDIAEWNSYEHDRSKDGPDGLCF